MSHHKAGTLSRSDQRSAESHTEHTASDNGCSANLVHGDSEFVGDSGQRTKRAGLRGGRYLRHPLEQRMAARTAKDPITGCWNFQGCKVGANGYGQICVGGHKLEYAHRVAWKLAHPDESIPNGLRVLHACDNPRCVNPDHLSLGTQNDNILDSIRKGRYNCFGRQKLNADNVREIRALWAQGWRQKDIGAKFGIKRHSVSAIVNGRAWAHLAEFDARQANLERVPTPRFIELPVRGDLLLSPGKVSA